MELSRGLRHETSLKWKREEKGCRELMEKLPGGSGWQMERAPTPYQTRRAVRVVTGPLHRMGQLTRTQIALRLAIATSSSSSRFSHRLIPKEKPSKRFKTDSERIRTSAYAQSVLMPHKEAVGEGARLPRGDDGKGRERKSQLPTAVAYTWVISMERPNQRL